MPQIDASIIITSVTDDSRVMLQIVESFTIVIYACNMFIVQATVIYSSKKFYRAGHKSSSC